jgi:hypothetical protein
VSPPRAVHHYPTREDNLLVCSSHIDASYMIAFGYPIVLIVVCTIYAVLTRKIPEAFNESKHIGMYLPDNLYIKIIHGQVHLFGWSRPGHYIYSIDSEYSTSQHRTILKFSNGFSNHTKHRDYSSCNSKQISVVTINANIA